MSKAEETPLVVEQSAADKDTETKEESQEAESFRKKLTEVLENVLGWSPFILVQVLGSGTFLLSTAFLAGTLAAAFVILYGFLISLASQTAFVPMMLDIGQFALFGSLYILALITNHAGIYTVYLQQLLFLWFNPLTTGGMGLIMWTSILNGRPFVFDYAKAKMPPALWERLSSKKWFREMMTKFAMFWVKTLILMTIIVIIQPLLVTIFYNGNPANDGSGFMDFLGLWLTVGQFGILFYAMYYTAKMGSRDARIRKRVKHVKKNGLSEEERRLYGGNEVYLDELDAKKYCIEALHDEKQLGMAAEVLTYAFRNDEMIHGFMNTEEAKLNFFKANLKSFAVFNHVFGIFNKFAKAQAKEPIKPSCVMACIPVYSKSREEIEVFNSFPAWLEHGFNISSETDFPLPDDDLMEAGGLKTKKENGLLDKPYIYISFFGSDLEWKGKGFGRVLAKHVIELSIKKQVPLVLETGTVHNREHYEKYGFKVVDCVKSRPDWVLMVRPPVGLQKGYGSV